MDYSYFCRKVKTCGILSFFYLLETLNRFTLL